MARNRDLMNGDDIAPRFGRRKALGRKDRGTGDTLAPIGNAEGTKGPFVPGTTNGEGTKGQRVGVPTRQPTAALSTRVSIPTRQSTAPIASKRMNLVAKAKQKIQGKAPVAARRVTPSGAMSALSRRPTLRTKR